MDDKGAVLLDLFVKPKLPVLDLRSHVSGIESEELLDGRNAAVDADVARERLAELLGEEQTILVGHCLQNDAMALRLCFGLNMVDTALLYGVEGKKSIIKNYV